MKTVAQWAEQLPELIRIEFVYEAEKQEVSNRVLVNPSATINAIIWIDTFLGTDFWHGVASCFYETPKSADYIDESVPYTKEEVEAMILEFADPNDEVCKVMLSNVGKRRDNDRVWNDLMETGVAVQQIEAPKDIVKQNIEASMVSALDYFNLRSDYFDLKEKNKALLEKVQTQGDLIVKQQNEVVALKREVEALDKKEFSVRFELIELKLDYQKRGSTIEAQKETIADLVKRIRTLDDTIYSQRETIKTLTQMRVAPKKEQSIFFDLLEHLNIIKK